MLVEHRSPTYKQLSESLSMRIQLTDGLRLTLSSERGPTNPNLFELRGTSRFRCCGNCVVTLSPDSFQIPGQDHQSLSIVRDISRKGIGIIAHQQWYPEQSLELILATATVEARVARVRRAGPFCYEVGLIIVKHELNRASDII